MKTLYLISFLFLGIAILTSCSKDKDKPLIIACDASASPYCYYVGNENAPVEGIDIDLVKEIGKELGRPVQINIVPFQYIFMLVSRGEADIGASGIAIESERSADILDSMPYDISAQVIVVPNESGIKDGASLKTARVAVQEGASDIAFLRETVKPKTLLLFLTLEEINSAFVNRRADAAVMDSLQAESFVNANKGKYRILEKPLIKHKYGLIFNQKDSKLVTAANTVIEKLKVSGDLQKIRSKHYDSLNTIPPRRENEDEGKPFIVCLEASFAPFVLINRNRLAGVDVEIAEEIAHDLKRPLRFKIVPFTDVLPLVESGSVDMGASGISITPEREKTVLFSEPYEKNVRRILVNTDAAYAKPEDLDGKVIGAKKGTKSEDFAVDGLHAEKTVHYDNAMQGILGLLNHEIEAYVEDGGEADLATDKIADLDGRRVKMLDVSFPLEEYGFAFHIDSRDLKAAVDKVIDRKRFRGEIKVLLRKYTSIYMTLDLNKD